MSAGTFVAGETGFFSAGTRVGCVLAWLLVRRMIGAPDQVGVPLRGFLRASLPCSMVPLTGAAAWLSAGGEVGISDGMVAKALSFGGRVIRRPRDDPSGTKEPY